MLCPICQAVFSKKETAVMPFCSERCRSIDLGRWLDEGYSFQRVPDPEDDETPDDNWSQEPLPESEEETE